MDNLKVIHAYGSLAPMPWQGPDGLAFGAPGTEDEVVAASRRLRTFTEGASPHSPDLSTIRGLLRDARAVLYLGCGFNNQNLSLLYGDDGEGRNTQRCPVIATAFEMSSSNVSDAQRQLVERGGYDQEKVHLLQTATCSVLVAEHSRMIERLLR